MSFSSLDMAKIPQGDNHFNVKDETDKGSNQWRQPVTPESPKAPLEFCEGQSETTSQQQQRSLCGVKDLSRLSRKRRTVQNGRLCSRRRNEEKDLGPNVDTKPRVSKIKDPLPMRQRLLPQSFFQQPTSISSSSLGQNTYSRLPPLFPQDHNPDEESTERPVTPPDERRQPHPKPAKRVVTSQPDTELLFRLFKTVTENPLEKKLVKRGRPKRVHSQKSQIPNPNHDEDPCMVEDLAGKLLPQLSLENGHCKLPNVVSLTSISIRSGDSLLQLPTLAVERNYPQMLRDIVHVL